MVVAWTVWAAVVVINLMIWVYGGYMASIGYAGPAPYFWPIWVVGHPGVILLSIEVIRRRL